jgi:hypothetical protein
MCSNGVIFSFWGEEDLGKGIPEEEVAQMDKFAVVFIFNIDHSPTVLTTSDLFSIDHDGTIRTNNGKWNYFLGRVSTLSVLIHCEYLNGLVQFNLFIIVFL